MSAGSGNPVTARPRLLFVCIENSNRSQMAEAFARSLGAGRVEAYSAGSRPSRVVNPRAIAFLRERGLEIPEQRSKGLDALPAGRWDAIVTMGCGDACPHLPALRRIDWELPDPKAMDDDGFRGVRDEIERRVTALIAEVAPGTAAGRS